MPKVVGKAFVTICKDCGKKTYGTHKTYSTKCSHCGSQNVSVKQSNIDVEEIQC